MRVLELKTLHGPNVFHARPVLIMTLDLERFADTASNEMPGFIERLVEHLPGLKSHHCSPGREGGFLERLRRGTYPAHIIEHITLEMSEVAGIGVSYGKSVYAGTPGHYNVITRFKNEQGMRVLLEGAVRAFESIAAGEEFAFDDLIARARHVVSATSLGPSGQALDRAARRRGIPCRRIGEASLLELGYGVHLRRVQAAVSDRTSLIATELVQDKSITKQLLREAMVPVPTGGVARNEVELIELLRCVPKPWVVKPLDGHHGQGVSIGLEDEASAQFAFRNALAYGPAVIVEQMVRGRDYRLLVINGRLAAAAERKPAQIVGDGISTVEALIHIANTDPRRGEGHSNLLTKIEIDFGLLEELRRQGLDRHSVPERDRVVQLRGTANLSTGGTARDVTDEVHPGIRDMAERIVRWVGLDICGIDLIHPDIRVAPGPGTAVIEVNAGPGLRMHISPSEGEPRDVAGTIVEALFPNGADGRIPIAAITGTNGKTTVTRLIAHCLGATGRCVGYTTSDGIWIAGRRVADGDTTGPRPARAVLYDPLVEAAVLETARGGLVRSGLGYDWSDVAVITNIRPDHFGQDGVEDIEDLVHIKVLVAERVRSGGTIVFNADDEQTLRLSKRPDLRENRDIVLYSLRAENAHVRAHIENGGKAYLIRGGVLVEAHNGVEMPLVRGEDLPFAFHGTADFQLSNALAASAAARTMGTDVETLRTALVSFQSQERNLGRSCIYRLGLGYVVLDYGHNPDAISAMAQTVKRWNPRRTIAVLGLPGDRTDELLKESAREIALGFDDVIVRDDKDLRDRASGEVPALIQKAILQINPYCRAQVELDGKAAIERALSTLDAGDVAVVFYDELDTALEVLRQYDPQPVTERLDLRPTWSRRVGLFERSPDHGDGKSIQKALSDAP